MEQALKQEIISDKSQLLNYFHSGFKSKTDFKVGMELEKLAVNYFDCKAVPYSKGIEKFLKRYDRDYLRENGNVLGIKEDFGMISLEPGSQCEISTFPIKSLHDLNNSIFLYNIKSSYIAEELDFCWLGYGIQPASTYESIELIPKKRYAYMTDYLPDKGELALIMMRETAGIQVALDYESEEDAINKLRTSLALSPIVTAMFANSPIREKKDTGYKSFRALSWLNTDEVRCGLVSKKLFDPDYEYTFEDHVEVLLDLPMIFIQKDNKYINMKDRTFRDYLNHGYEGHRASMDDWFLHTNLFFPDVRLNNYIEIRNCDSQREDLILAPAALWKGILYNQDAMQSAFDLVKELNYENLMELRSLVPKYALDTQIDALKVSDAAKELVNIAYKSLKQMNIQDENGYDESIYLESLFDLVNQSKTPADLILQRWYSDWNKNTAELVEYSKI
ncbi:MAG: glutamate-cysteine ligase family protein [Candidatus Gastranaerophilales bacterium]|nr:glutamate-cysteine ligase family protein [Candidatus Gastranaerophilales bacterium]